MQPDTPEGFQLDQTDDRWLARVNRALTGPGAAAAREGLTHNTGHGHQAGDRVGSYALARLIGSGGMGEVWLARRADGLFDRDVAVKVIKRGMDTDAVIRRFHNERHVLATLHHPHIARLYDAGAAEDGRPYLVMEYVDGLPITTYCDVHALGIDERLRLFQLSCLAVHHAHSHLVLHRDLKPSNLLITGDANPKLLDFGIAKLLDGDGRLVSATTDANMRLLTPRYASPEQIAGGRLTTATDVYSLGVILFHLMTGRDPYNVRTGTRAEIERAVADQEPLRPSAAARQRTDLSRSQVRRLQRRLRGDIDAIVMTALRKDPSRRYASAEQLAEDIHRHLEGSPLLAKRPGVMARVRRAIRRRRASLAAAVCGMVIGVGLATAFVIDRYLKPAWMATRLDRARMAIIGPRSNNDIYTIIFYNDPKTRSNSYEQVIDRVTLEQALSHYHAAARLARTHARATDEYHVVQMALLPLNDTARNTILDDFRIRLPLTYAYAENNAHRVEFTDKQLEAAGREDLRSLGLIALLWGNVELTINAWTLLDIESADPLVEALLGNIYLAMNRPELAYPRLLSAHRELPDSTNLMVYLADAAARCGDTRQARRLLKSASEQSGLTDKTLPIERVEMCCLLAEGRTDEALLLYENTKVLDNPVASMQLARYFDERGDVPSALDTLASRTFSYDQTNMQTYCRLLESWWSRLSCEEQDSFHARTLSADGETADGFVHLLRCYARDQDLLRRHPNPHPLQEQSNWTNLENLASPDAMRQAELELTALVRRLGE